jgi:rhodanese-related sulfurtransferase
MQSLDIKKKMLVFFVIVTIGVVGIDVWQSSAEITKDSKSEPEKVQILKNITPKEAYDLIQEHKDDENFVILDVRTPREFAQGYIKNAKNVDYYSKTFRDELDKLDKDKTYLVYCRSGNRSGRTLRVMQELNYSHAYNMTGGIGGWYTQGLPITK